MEIDIEKEYERFIDNYEFNKQLFLKTEKPHLARWAYGACEQWIKSFVECYIKWINGGFDGFSPEQIKNRDACREIIKEKRKELPILKQELRDKFKDNEILMERLK